MEKKKKDKLIEIYSLHEQREMFGNPDILIKKGVWIEIIDFERETEMAEVLRRFEVEKVEKNQIGHIKKYKVICKELDIEEMGKERRKSARLVLDKHREKLKASFAKCLVEGIDVRSIQDLKNMSNKLNIYSGGKNDNK